MKWLFGLISLVFVVQQDCPMAGDDDTEPGETAPPCDVAALDPYVQPPAFATPSDPLPGTTLTIHYLGPLRDASQLEIHYGFNGWNATQAPDMLEEDVGNDHVYYRDLPMARVEGEFQVDIDIPMDGKALHFVFHDPNSGMWDNNNGLDYQQSILFPYIGPFLTWNEDVGPSDGVVVNWETSLPGLGVVEYGPTEALGNCAVGEMNDTMHHVRLADLEAGTDWYYRVYDSTGNRSEIFRFSTAGRDISAFKFVVMSDSQDNGEEVRWKEVADEIRNAHVDANFVIGAGDMTADDNPGHWWTFFDGGRELFAERPFMPTMGNHDGPDWTSFLRYFELPSSSGSETYYWFQYGRAGFLGLNTEDPSGFGLGSGAQYLFAEEVLADCGWGASRSCAPVFAFWHIPPYNAGARHCYEQGMFRDMTGLFDGVVDWTFGGHEHLYQRMIPLQYNAVPAPSGRYGVGPDEGVGYIVLPPAGNLPSYEIVSSDSEEARYRDRLAYPVLAGDETQVASEIGFVTVEVDGPSYTVEAWGMGDINMPQPAHVRDFVSVP